MTIFREGIDFSRGSISYCESTVLHQLDQKIIYPHYDFKHLTEKYFEIEMKLNDFSIQLVKYWSICLVDLKSKIFNISESNLHL